VGIPGVEDISLEQLGLLGLFIFFFFPFW